VTLCATACWAACLRFVTSCVGKDSARCITACTSPGAQVDLPAAADPLATLFSEELGLLLEVAPEHEAEVLAAYADAGVSATAVGSVAADAGVSIAVGGQPHISGEPLL
jgi:AIR synthase related protein, C-terminal domain